MKSVFFSKDVFSVVVNEGKKMIKPEYFFYDGDNAIQCVEFTWCYVDIPATEEEIAMAEENCLQYQGDVTEEQYKSYCEMLSKLPHLPYEEVTEDTPFGYYINM